MYLNTYILQSGIIYNQAYIILQKQKKTSRSKSSAILIGIATWNMGLSVWNIFNNHYKYIRILLEFRSEKQMANLK